MGSIKYLKMRTSINEFLKVSIRKLILVYEMDEFRPGASYHGNLS